MFIARWRLEERCSTKHAEVNNHVRVRMVSDRIKGSTHTKKTQNLSEQLVPGGKVVLQSSLRTPLLLSATTNSLVFCRIKSASIHHYSILSSCSLINTKWDNLEVKSLDLKSGFGTKCTGLFNGLMGRVMGLHLTMKRQRIHWRRNIDDVRVENQLLTKQFDCFLVNAWVEWL